MKAPVLLHLATTDMSLALLLGPQLRAFSEAGYQVHAASAAGPWSAALSELGVTHHPLRHATRARAWGQDLAALAEVFALVRRLRPDVLHTHNPKPGIYGRLAGRAAGVPVVLNTVHGLFAQPTDRWRRRLPVYALERVAAACSDLELVQNVEDAAMLRRLRVPAERVRTLGNGVDLNRFADPERHRAAAAALRTRHGISPDGVLVLAVGRLVAEKGYRDLFTAAQAIHEVGGRLMVAGGAEPDKSDALTEDELADARAAGVILLGHRDDVEVLYAAADIFVLASHREGFPRAAMEAAAAGLPVVAANIRGSRQVVADGTSGVLVPVRNPDRLGTAVARLVTDPDARARLGAAGRERARTEFDDRRVIRRTLSAYAGLLAGAGIDVPPAAAGAAPIRLVRDGPDARRLAAQAAALHAAVLPGSFLATLGPRFLRRLYLRIIASQHSFLLVAEGGEHADGDIQGFCAGTEDTAALYREFAWRDGFFAAASTAPRLLTQPRAVLDTWSYGRGTGALARPPAELLALGVRPDSRRLGLGGELVRACQAELSARGGRGATVTVGADNTPALVLYQRQGFHPVGTCAVHRGAPSLALTWP